MKLIYISFAWLALIAGTQAASEINKSLFGGVAIEGYDPVAYHTEQKPVKGDKAHTYSWKDANWRFASAANLALFKADPEKYAPQYGGYCAYAVSQNSTAKIDPTQWTIVDGKLYLNYNKKINVKWTANRDEFITLADKYWPDVVK